MDIEVTRSGWIGRVIEGRFPLIEWLGGSGRTSVFRTELRGEGAQKAVIKLIPADSREDKAHIAHWAETASMSYPHLVRLLWTGRCRIDTAPFHYVVTEYAAEVLSQILPERALTEDEAREMLDPILDALAYLHGKRLVHGHLKPSNILVVDNRLKLSADSLHVAGEMDEHFAIPGAYDAPEVAARVISPAADVWSLGVTLVEALTQVPANHVPKSMPQPFAGIAQGCLERNPASRSSLSDLKARLEGKAEPHFASARKFADPDDLDRKPRGTVQGKVPWGILIAAILVLLAVAAATLIRSRHAATSSPGEPARSVPQSPVAETEPAAGALVKGMVAERVIPDVPEKASRTIHGQVKVSVRVTVDPGGAVSSAALDSPGPSRYFSGLAVRAAQHWKFRPAQIGGKAVPSVWILRFSFRQGGSEANSAEVTP